jgi:hypothetical protein
MTEERAGKIIPLMFKNVKISKKAKNELRSQLFYKTELSDDDLTYVAAAGAPTITTPDDELDVIR